jgi:hypothetical protein
MDRFIVIYVKQYIYDMDRAVHSIHTLYSVVYHLKQYMHKYVDINRVNIVYIYIDRVNTMEYI